MKYWLFICVLGIGIFLRLYHLGSLPISLHEDEVGVGYNAFTLLTTGKDEHGVAYPITLREDAPPIIFYAAVPSLFIFGATNMAVRFPSALIGIATIAAFYWACFELGKIINKSTTFIASSKKFALFCMLLIAITPWHIQLTRIVHAAEFALFFQVLAVASFFTFIRKLTPLWIYASGLFFGLGFYTYHSSRLTSPLLFILLIWFFRKELANVKVTIIRSIFLAILIALPTVIYVALTPLPQTRFGGVNIFIGQKKDASLLITVPLKFTQQIITQLNPKTLFSDSRNTRYFHIEGSGLLFLSQLPLFIYGMWLLRKNIFLVFLLVWGFIELLPGALTLGPLNAGRIAGVLPVWTIFSGIGVTGLIRKKRFFYVFVAGTALSLNMFLNHYFIESALLFSSRWQYGLKEAAEFATKHESEYKHIIFDKSFRQPYIYVLFYGKKSLSWLLTNNPIRNPVVGYTAFGNYEFREVDWKNDINKPQTLIVSPFDKVPATISATLQINDIGKVPRISLISIPNKVD